MPLYVGDDIADEAAFQALSGGGVGFLVAGPADVEIAGAGRLLTMSLAGHRRWSGSWMGWRAEHHG